MAVTGEKKPAPQMRGGLGHSGKWKPYRANVSIVDVRAFHLGLQGLVVSPLLFDQFLLILDHGGQYTDDVRHRHDFGNVFGNKANMPIRGRGILVLERNRIEAAKCLQRHIH